MDTCSAPQKSRDDSVAQCIHSHQACEIEMRNRSVAGEVEIGVRKRCQEALDVSLCVLARATFLCYDMRTNVLCSTHEHRSSAVYPRSTTSTPEMMAYPSYQQIEIANVPHQGKLNGDRRGLPNLPPCQGGGFS